MDYLHASFWYSRFRTAECCSLQCHYGLLTCLLLVLLQPRKVCGCIDVMTMSLWKTYLPPPGIPVSEPLPAAAKNVTTDYFYASSWYSPLGTAACWRLGRSVDVSYLVQCHYESLTMSLLTCSFLVFASRNRCLLSPRTNCGCMIVTAMSF